MVAVAASWSSDGVLECCSLAVPREDTTSLPEDTVRRIALSHVTNDAGYARISNRMFAVAVAALSAPGTPVAATSSPAVRR